MAKTLMRGNGLMRGNTYMRGVLGLLRQAVLSGDRGLSDGELLTRYLVQREESAFAALVHRHGPMVLAVCRRILGNVHDADDAFQATFLVLVRRAGAIVPRDMVGPWLHGVACRTSAKAKAMSSRRRAKQRSLEESPEPAAADRGVSDWSELLDAELSRLPDKYRLPLVLCDLEGRTRKAAARRLGWPEGTVATRLQHGRKLVHQRLVRRGITLSATALAAMWSQTTAAAQVPGQLLGATVQAASVFAASAAHAPGLISIKVVALVEGVLKSMVLKKLKTVTALVVVFGLLGLGLSGWTFGGGTAAGEPQPPTIGKPPPAPVPPTSTSGPADTADGRLPTGPTPRQALVSLSKDGRYLRVRTSNPVYQPRETVHNGQKATFYELIHALRTDAFVVSAVETYDTRRRKLDNRELPKLLAREIPALVLVGTRELDPLHLRLIKDDTLIFVLPYREGLAVPFAPVSEAVGHPGPLQIAPSHAVPPSQGVPPVAPAAATQSTPAPKLPPRSHDVSPLVSSEWQAEHDLAIADFYRRAGHPASAAFYYELIQKRYPGSAPADKAAQHLQELRGQTPDPLAGAKPARVGEIVIVGNRKVPDAVIRQHLPLLPGQVLQEKDLRAAEESLRRLFADEARGGSRPSVTVLDNERDRRYKDILVTVQDSISPEARAEMKKLHGTWRVVSATMRGVATDAFAGVEIVFAGDQNLWSMKDKVTHGFFAVNPSARPKTIEMFPAKMPSGATGPMWAYELDGDTLRLCLGSEHSPPRAIRDDGHLLLTLRRQ